jgi:hypothetical protein
MFLQKTKEEPHIAAIGLDRERRQPPLIAEMGGPAGKRGFSVGGGGEVERHWRISAHGSLTLRHARAWPEHP